MQFTFVPEHGKEYKISTTESGGNVVYISSDDPSEVRRAHVAT